MIPFTLWSIIVAAGGRFEDAEVFEVVVEEALREAGGATGQDFQQALRCR